MGMVRGFADLLRSRSRLGRRPRRAHPDCRDATSACATWLGDARTDSVEGNGGRAMRSIGMGIAAACVLVLAISGCDKAPGNPGSNPPVPRPEAELNFDVLYRQNCAGCHGADGKNGAALDLANPVYQSWVDDGSLRTWVSHGMPQTQMPAFAISAGGSLTDKQIDVLVRGMRQRWAPAGGQLNRMPPYLQPADADASHGKQVFERSCAACHEHSKQGITSPDYLALVG